MLFHAKIKLKAHYVLTRKRTKIFCQLLSLKLTKRVDNVNLLIIFEKKSKNIFWYEKNLLFNNLY